MRTNSVLLLLLVALAIASGCSDVVSSDGWSVRESGPTDWKPLDGPPGSLNRPLGRIGEKYVFEVGERASGESVFAYYRPESGWNTAHGINSLVREHEALGFNTFPIATAGDHFIFGSDTNRPFRSSDGGETWSELETFPDVERVAWFGAEGGALFMLASTGESRTHTLWRSVDRGQSWEIARDNIERYLHIDSGLIAVSLRSGFGGVAISNDNGETWNNFAQTCQHLLSATGLFRWNNRTFFVGDGLFEFEPARGCPEVDLHGIGEVNSFLEVEDVDNEVYSIRRTSNLVGSPANAELGSLDLDRARWQAVDLLPELSLDLPRRHVDRPRHLSRSAQLLDFGRQGLGVWTTHGLFRTMDSGESWESVGHAYANTAWVTEYRGDVLARNELAYFARSSDGGEWRPVARATDPQSHYEPGYLIVRNDELFAVGQANARLYRLNMDEGTSELVWQDERASFAYQSRGLPADLEFHNGKIFIRSQGSIPQAVLPGSEEAAAVRMARHTGGGVFVTESFNAPFQQFGEALPKETASGTASIQSMAIHGGSLWVLTAISGVWRATPSDGHWVEVHDGLPIAGPGEETPIQALVEVDERLYAFSTKGIYVAEDNWWRRLTTDDFALEVTREEREGEGILGVLSYQGNLMVAASNGLYVLDDESGEYRRIWQPEDSTILVARSLPSGLYVGIKNGGVWRLTPPE